MKSTFKTLLLLAVMLSATSVFAQKLARIDTEALFRAMPESDSLFKKIETFTKESEAEMEVMQVEFNNKLADYEKKQTTLTPALKEQKEKELRDLGARLQEYPSIVQKSQQEMYQKMFTPIQEKALNAIKKVGKDNNFACVLNNQAILYTDDAQVTDILPLVKKELGLKQ